jgi:hypothetical protein
VSFGDLAIEQHDVRVLFAGILEAASNPTFAAHVKAQLDALRAELEARAKSQGLAEPRAVALVVAATLDGLLLHRSIDSTTDMAAAGRALRALIDAAPKK